MPYSGCAVKGFDLYNIRSGYAPAVSSMQFYYEDSVPEDMEQQKRQGEEYLRVRPYLSQDMYPLTEPSAKLDVWMAAQYHRPSQGDGLIQVFRRERSPYETAQFKLCGLEEEAEYWIEDMDDGSWVKAAGSQLMRGGFELTIEKPRTAKLFIYTKI